MDFWTKLNRNTLTEPELITAGQVRALVQGASERFMYSGQSSTVAYHRCSGWGPLQKINRSPAPRLCVPAFFAALEIMGGRLCGGSASLPETYPTHCLRFFSYEGLKVGSGKKWRGALLGRGLFGHHFDAVDIEHFFLVEP